MLPDKITVTLHALLLTLLAIQIGYLCGLYRCGEMEQMANVIDCCTFDLFGDFFFMFYLIYEIKMDLLADEADKLAVNATQMYSTTCNYTQTVHRSIHSVIVNQGFFFFSHT